MVFLAGKGLPLVANCLLIPGVRTSIEDSLGVDPAWLKTAQDALLLTALPIVHYFA